MHLVPPSDWIFVGNCPICQCGLRRVRACRGPDEMGPIHGYILCDDCETLWLQPDVSSAHAYPDVEAPACPVCRMPLYGAQARWASEKDLVELGWREQCVVEPAYVAGARVDQFEPDGVDESSEPRPGC